MSHPIQWVPDFFSGVECPGSGIEHPHPSSAKMKERERESVRARARRSLSISAQQPFI